MKGAVPNSRWAISIYDHETREAPSRKPDIEVGILGVPRLDLLRSAKACLVDLPFKGRFLAHLYKWDDIVPKGIKAKRVV